MSSLLEGPGERAVGPLAISLTLLLAYVFALGCVSAVSAFVRALFGTAEGLLGWIPWLGKIATRPIHSIEQKIVSALGTAAADLEGRVADAFHGAATSLRNLGHEIYGLAEFGYELSWYIVKAAKIMVVGHKVYTVELAQLKAQRAARAEAARVAKLAKVVAHPGSGKSGGAIAARTRPLKVQLADLRHWTMGRVKALEYSESVAIPGALDNLRARDGVLERLWHGLKGRFGKLERATVGAGAVGLVAIALAKLGMTWARCSNVRRLGRGVCRMDGSFIEDLLAGTLLVVGGISIVEFSKELQTIMGDAEAGIRGFIRETK